MFGIWWLNLPYLHPLLWSCSEVRTNGAFSECFHHLVRIRRNLRYSEPDPIHANSFLTIEFIEEAWHILREARFFLREARKFLGKDWQFLREGKQFNYIGLTVPQNFWIGSPPPTPLWKIPKIKLIFLSGASLREPDSYLKKPNSSMSNGLFRVHWNLKSKLT